MSLKNLIALQNKKAQGDAAPSIPPAATDSPSDAPKGDAPKKAGLGLNLAGAGRGVGGGSGKPVSPPVQPQRVAVNSDGPDAGEADGHVFGLADLAGFDASEDSAPVRDISGSGFDDEIEATAPDRALEPDLTAQQLAFVESLDGIYPVLHDPELFGQAVRTIMMELGDNPEYKKLIADQDVHTMIRGMRNTMGLARIRKQEKSRKAGGAAKKGARGKSAVSDEDMAMLAALMGDD